MIKVKGSGLEVVGIRTRNKAALCRGHIFYTANRVPTTEMQSGSEVSPLTSNLNLFKKIPESDDEYAFLLISQDS